MGSSHLNSERTTAWLPHSLGFKGAVFLFLAVLVCGVPDGPLSHPGSSHLNSERTLQRSGAQRLPQVRVVNLGLGASVSGVPSQLPSAYIGNQACARCHSQIYESYLRTSMANASGPATQNLIAGEFTHKPSGVQYKIVEDHGKVLLTFNRPGDSFVHGQREFLYYIGQGRRGRTYLFSADGFLFESPVNWYADRHLWDMAPAYGSSPTMPL